MRIVTENLSYTYGEKSKGLEVKALSGVSLTIEDGEIFGIIGKTGSGKTTFVQHLNGLIRVQKNAGRVIVGEYDLSDKKCDMKSLRAKIGMMFQYPEYQLFAETVKDDVAFGIKNFFPNLGEKETEERVKTALNLVGLDYDRYKDKSPFELSGGQKRRAAIAGVIVTRPEVLVLDEPAAGLDPVGKREFISLLKRLHGEFVKTIVIVSHDMNLVAENCTRAAVFSHGQIIAEGTPKDVFERENAVKEGLELPVTAYLARELNARGYKISVSDLTVNGFADAVAKEFFARKKRGREE